MTLTIEEEDELRRLGARFGCQLAPAVLPHDPRARRALERLREFSAYQSEVHTAARRERGRRPWVPDPELSRRHREGRHP